MTNIHKSDNALEAVVLFTPPLIHFPDASHSTKKEPPHPLSKTSQKIY